MQQRSFWNIYIDQVVETVICYNAGIAMVSLKYNKIDGITILYLLDNKKVYANKHLEPRVESLGVSRFERREACSGLHGNAEVEIDR